MNSTIGVQVETELFLQLANFLRSEGSTANPTDIVNLAIEYWLDNASWKKEDLIPNRKRGYMWKEVLLPHMTSLRIRVPDKQDFAYAEVEDDKLYFEGRAVSPAEFANTATGTTRNAWRDVWVKRPGDQEWIIADNLRQT